VPLIVESHLSTFSYPENGSPALSPPQLLGCYFSEDYIFAMIISQDVKPVSLGLLPVWLCRRGGKRRDLLLRIDAKLLVLMLADNTVQVGES
jgi:hypothetical protein